MTATAREDHTTDVPNDLTRQAIAEAMAGKRAAEDIYEDVDAMLQALLKD